MVSLENSRNAKGGFSFDHTSPITINEDVNEEINQINSGDQLPLTTDVEPNFKQIKTPYVIILQIFTIVCVLVGCYLIPHFCGDNDEKCPQLSGFSIVVFIHGGMWIIKYIFDRYYHFQHMKMRRNGYLRFYRLTQLIRSLPLIILSAGNSILVILLKLIDKFCPVKCTQLNLDPTKILQIFITIECVLLFPILIYYLVLTIKFNSSKKSPDIATEMSKPTAFLTSQLKDIGYKDSTFLTNILENQADMIRYLQERNEKLSQKLFQLTNQRTSQLPQIN